MRTKIKPVLFKKHLLEKAYEEMIVNTALKVNRKKEITWTRLKNNRVQFSLLQRQSPTPVNPLMHF